MPTTSKNVFESEQESSCAQKLSPEPRTVHRVGSTAAVFNMHKSPITSRSARALHRISSTDDATGVNTVGLDDDVEASILEVSDTALPSSRPLQYRSSTKAIVDSMIVHEDSK